LARPPFREERVMKKFFTILMVTLLTTVLLAGTAGALPSLFAPIAPISEPAAMMLFGFGLNCLAVVSRKGLSKRD
jgi:FtsH-binding integral membrane protein